MSDDLTERQADSQAESLTELWAAYDHLAECGTLDRDQCDECGALDPELWFGDAGEVLERLDERPLEIVWRKGSPFEVLLGFGGPNVWIEADARYDQYELHVAWGGDRAVRRSEAITRTGAYFREMMEDDE